MKVGIAVLVMVVLLFPIYYMVAGSFMSLNRVMRQPPALWPNNPTMDNYHRLLSGQPVLMWVLNTTLLAVGIVGGSLVVCAMAGYAFSTQRGLGWLHWLFLASIMVPRSVLIIPTFVQMRVLGVSGTLVAAGLPALFFPVGIFMFRNHCDSIPRAFIDCARVDGANELQVMTKVIAPLSSAILATLGVMKFVEALTDYIWQFLTLMEDDRKTLVVGVMSRILMQRGAGADTNQNVVGISLAAGVVMFLPLLIAFVLLQKHFRRGVMTGGVKD